jgi:hypothetical protein
VLVALATAPACGDEPIRDAAAPWPPFDDVREPCADRDPRRQLLFGDLHVHTALSWDAYVSAVTVTPEQAYAFARGEPVTLPVTDPGGAATGTAGTYELRIDRPLDFAAVTDHAEYLAEVGVCSDPSSAAYASTTCVELRTGTDAGLRRLGQRLQDTEPTRLDDLCGGADDCETRAQDVWRRLQLAAEAAYDRSSACSFTSFVAYEWTGAPNLANLHRNVVFRSAAVPDTPTSFYEAATPWALWDRLEADCTAARFDPAQFGSAAACAVMSIPHNPNWSNGNLFDPATPADRPRAAALAQRAAMEPVMELYQHKGDSECDVTLDGVDAPPDPACAFEKLRRDDYEDCGDTPGTRGIVGLGCVSRNDFVRGILLTGLGVEQADGINPFMLGLLASTDTHNGTPGAVDEQRYVGHFGSREGDAGGRLAPETGNPNGVRNSPGGLTAVWAESNTREDLFDALQRREVYGTSGPRIAVRAYAGWDLPANLCDDGVDLVAEGDRAGVAMGARLPPPPDAAAPLRIAVAALADPGTAEQPGTPLQRVQVIKGWVDEAGVPHLRVFDIAGGDDGASVDPDTCAPLPGPGGGARSLCGVWTDSDAASTPRAYYYVRVLEDPTCRWSTRACLALAPADRPSTCADPLEPTTIQERAWTSPFFRSDGG